MKSAPEILAEIDSYLIALKKFTHKKDEAMSLEEGLESLKAFILSEPEKCEHSWATTLVFYKDGPDLNITRCLVCGAVK